MFKRFLFYLIDEAGRSYYPKPNGQFGTTSQKIPLQEAPDGWQEIQIAYERDPKKLGVVRSFTLPLAVVKSVRQIVRAIVFTRSLEEKIFLLIQKLSASVGSGKFEFLYRFFYKGQVDLYKFRYEDEKDSISIKEGGISQLLESGEGTDFDIPLDSDTERVPVIMDGLELRESGNYFITFDVELLASVFSTYFAIPVSLLNKEGTAFGFGFLSQEVESLTDYALPDRLERPNYIGAAVADVTLHIKGTIAFRCTVNDPPFGFRARFMKSSQDFSNQNDYQIFDVGSLVPGNIYSLDVDLDISLQKDERLYLHGILYGAPTGAIDAGIVFLKGSDLVFSYKSRYRTTVVNTLKISTVFKRLAQKMGIALTQLQTDFLEKNDNLVLTSGDGIRGLQGAGMKTSLNDFTEFVRVVLAGGQGIENEKLFYNPYSYFMRSDDPIHLGPVKNLRVYPAESLLGNTIKIGYPGKDIDDVNGRYSFNNASLFTTPRTNAKELSFLCPYVSDPFYAEITRINLVGKTTTDNAADNEIFILNTEPISETFDFDFFTGFDNNFIAFTGTVDMSYIPAGSKISFTGTQFNNQTFTIFFSGKTATGAILVVQETVIPELVTAQVIYSTRKLKRVTYDSITGIPEPDYIFNIEDLTPMRLMRKQASWINSLFQDLTGKKIVFESTDKNKDLETVKDGVTISEKGSHIIGTDILFKPWFLEFETILPADLSEIVDTDRNRPFTFEWYGNIYKGISWKMADSPSDEKPQIFKLLCAPDTDLSKLIISD